MPLELFTVGTPIQDAAAPTDVPIGERWEERKFRARLVNPANRRRLSVILVGMHLRHGIWSATQTLGQSNRRREVTVNYAATAIATVLTIGFLLTPFSILFGLID